ncbi:RsmB/NOP family class I SAM-dependent RNA methyltransferase [Protaetiibacter mangrovi]|uniref:rRNA small subunit methyltransferase B n=1 Tax=Protaetiibacter mangrovi TaxID=2970926 RepID=A0ABT1ZBY3_9MICO|nr:transcription antitermination factor NusB [Protaetiibacter mangrovi]MCS0498208.1 rRNA small subunit methyltransferase B [Protaetiibacter mangrovi]TPW91925.1 rRNA small subunit methyltransferase B [Schumannella luteola]
MSRVQPSRRVAAEVLGAVRTSDAYANLLLPVRIREAGLSSADAGFATELVYGTLRMQGYYDKVVELASRRPAEKIDGPVLDVLRLGVHQLLSLRTAAHAVIDESVQLVRIARKASAAGFVNGVLRTVARDDADTWRERSLAGLHGDARLAVEFSHPAWVVRALASALAREDAAGELDAALAADNLPPQVAFAALPGLADPVALESGAGYRPGRLSPLALGSTGGDPADRPEVAAGAVRVQDEGSQLAALALTRARPVTAGESWLDLCAGPGGKAAVLAAEARVGGAHLQANEVVPARAGLVRNALAPFGSGADAPEVVEGDGRRFGEAGARFDRVLLDAPCTGLGALRRRPEARWRKSAADLAALTALQAQLLDAAVASLASGGLLAYVTCSPHPAETLDQVDAVLARHPELRAVDTPAVLGGISRAPLALPERGSAQLWPHRHGTDAMFIQLLTKVEE